MITVLIRSNLTESKLKHFGVNAGFTTGLLEWTQSKSNVNIVK